MQTGLVRCVLVSLASLSLAGCALLGDREQEEASVASSVEIAVSGQVQDETLNRHIAYEIDSGADVEDLVIVRDLPRAIFDPVNHHSSGERADLYVAINSAVDADGQVTYELRLTAVPPNGPAAVLGEPVLVADMDEVVKVHFGIDGGPLTSSIDLSLQPLHVL